jgi:hypothetical protein
MNCKLAQERVVAAAYGEIPDDQVHELERHVTSCVECKQARQQALAIKALADAYPVLEPEPNLVARARLRLEEALDALPPKRWYERLGQRIRNGVASLQAAPVTALLLAAAAAGAGGLGGYRIAQNGVARLSLPAAPLLASTAASTAASAPASAPASAGARSQPAAAQPELENVASVSGVARRPGSEIVDVSYNQLVPRQIEGSLEDPAIRRLLMTAVRNPASPGVRDSSVGLLATESKASHGHSSAEMRDALLLALRSDRNAAVRQTALHGLRPYVAKDMRVRDAVLEALLNDDDSGVRNAAIDVLAPVEADTSVRQVLYSVSTSDDNPHIRNASREILSQVPEIQ